MKLFYKIAELLIIGGIISAGFFLCFASGSRGFFAFDQSMTFDGAWRILCGQVPFKDFFMPFGPMAFWLQAGFFKLLGVNYFAYIFAASFVNLLATLCGIVIIKILFPGRSWLAYLCGIITAVWFYSIYGTTNAEQTAFFFSLAGITFVLPVLLYRLSVAAARSLLLASGVCALLSLISKQNAGAFIFPLYFLLIILGSEFSLKMVVSRSMWFFLGFFLSLSVFCLWLVIYSRPAVFLEYFLRIPWEVGMNRIIYNPFHAAFFDSAGLLFIQYLFWFSLVVAVYVFFHYLFNLIQGKEFSLPRLLASFLCIYTVFFQYLFMRTAMNQKENGFPFLGIILAAVSGFILPKKSPRKRVVLNWVLAVLIGLSSIYVIVYGVETALTRKVQDVFSGSKFPKRSFIKKLEVLKWGQPTEVLGYDVQESDIAAVYEYLEAQNKPFFIFPDFTIFYGLLNFPSPQPVLWFDKGFSYSKRYDAKLDEWVVDDLKKKQVAIVVLEEKSFLTTDKRLGDFPQLKAYIFDNFIKVRSIGIFSVYEKKIL